MKIYRMVKEKKFVQMAPLLKVYIKMVKRMVLANFNRLMVQYIRVILKMINLMVMEFTIGQISVYIKENG